MVLGLVAAEYATELFANPVSFDAVPVQDCRMRCQT